MLPISWLVRRARARERERDGLVEPAESHDRPPEATAAGMAFDRRHQPLIDAAILLEAAWATAEAAG